MSMKPSDVLWRYMSVERRLNEAVAEVERLRAEFGQAADGALALVKKEGPVTGYDRVFALDDDERLTVVPVKAAYVLDSEYGRGTVRIAGREEALAVAAADFDLPEEVA